MKLGIIGARGHVGKELLGLAARHSELELEYVSSRAWEGRTVADELGPDAAPNGFGEFGAMRFESLEAGDVARRHVDVCVLALPNGVAEPYVRALSQSPTPPVMIDVSADYRFDDDWFYGLPELTRDTYSGERHISNPGCYATGIQLAIAPLLDLLAAPPHCFGVSGYSGAGTTPSRRNDTQALADNLMPYQLTGHLHEREASRHLGREVLFTPHVASFFRGLSVTAMLSLEKPLEREALIDRYRERFEGEALIEISDQIPEVKQAAHQHEVTLGGFGLDETGKRAVIIATLDNLLKGAATQALQNINLACGFNELEGIRTTSSAPERS